MPAPQDSDYKMFSHLDKSAVDQAYWLSDERYRAIIERAALQALRANIDALGLKQRTTVVTSDVPAWVPALRGVDLALIDPPYEFDGWEQLLTVLKVPYAVAEAGHEIEPPPGWEALKSRRYGRTWVTQLERVA